MLRKILTVSFSFLMLTGCSGLFEKDVVKIAPVPEFDNKIEVHELWSKSVGSGSGTWYTLLAPAVDSKYVFAADRGGNVYSIDRITGSTIWSTDLDDEDENDDKRSARLSGGVAEGESNVYVGSENGWVYALSKTDGKLAWKSNPGCEIVSKPAADSGSVFVLCSNGCAHAYSEYDGSEIWNTAAENQGLTVRGVSSVLAKGGVIIYGTAAGNTAIVHQKNGLLLNMIRTGHARGASNLERLIDVDSAPVLDGTVLYTVAYQGDLVATDLRQHRELWRTKLSSLGDISVGGGKVFVTDDQGHVQAISSYDGGNEWHNDALSYRNVTGTAAAGGYVVVGDMDGYLYFLDAYTGEFAAKYRLDRGSVYSAPAVYDGIIYAETSKGNVYAIALPGYVAPDESPAEEEERLRKEEEKAEREKAEQDAAAAKEESAAEESSDDSETSDSDESSDDSESSGDSESSDESGSSDDSEGSDDSESSDDSGSSDDSSSEAPAPRKKHGFSILNPGFSG
ncbi:MAG: outer membrane protein assembly factor BamB [Succinivibrionaceae bacterium]|jgi:outer membrane protein assembly factor BamB|nr:outer membrane protein assembly factor BamB [Pseudomonadota bacterium]MDY3144260.1 outer membrane protein assembly factor BamB [Succinivibrionaceae bacterium]MDY6274213.1 outer membrane protein assembly factor BamB [Succinivibrionaceae bacterium]MDY6336955.1 outer membrane protein assembly factor BamB [Succinivibrionaceae bacterium]